MRMTGGARRAAALGFASCLLVGLAACSPDNGQAEPSSSVSASSSKASSRSAPAPTLPKGHRWRTIDDVHVTFAAPDTWTALDPAKLGALSVDSPEMKALAKKLGMTSKQVTQFMANVDLYLAGPLVEGYAPNIQAVVLPLDELPSDAALAQEIGRVATSPPKVEHMSTGIGDGVNVSFSMNVGALTLYGRSLFYETADGVLNLTVGAPDEATAQRLATMLTDSIHTS
jgi:hypothetical protein